MRAINYTTRNYTRALCAGPPQARVATVVLSLFLSPSADKCILNGRSGSINVKREKLRCAPKSRERAREILLRNLTIAAQIRHNSLRSGVNGVRPVGTVRAALCLLRLTLLNSYSHSRQFH